MDFLLSHIRKYTFLVGPAFGDVELSCGFRWGPPDPPSRKLRAAPESSLERDGEEEEQLRVWI